jgi:hypothetical protein
VIRLRRTDAWDAIPGSDETIFRCPRRQAETNVGYQGGIKAGEEGAMNAIVANVLMREAAKAQVGVHPLGVVLFCGIGLLASLCMASLGFDIGAGFF